MLGQILRNTEGRDKQSYFTEQGIQGLWRKAALHQSDATRKEQSNPSSLSVLVSLTVTSGQVLLNPEQFQAG